MIQDAKSCGSLYLYRWRPTFPGCCLLICSVLAISSRSYQCSITQSPYVDEYMTSCQSLYFYCLNGDSFKRDHVTAGMRHNHHHHALHMLFCLVVFVLCNIWLSLYFICTVGNVCHVTYVMSCNEMEWHWWLRMSIYACILTHMICKCLAAFGVLICIQTCIHASQDTDIGGQVFVSCLLVISQWWLQGDTVIHILANSLPLQRHLHCALVVWVGCASFGIFLIFMVTWCCQ